MTVFTEGRHTSEGLLSEANGNRSRERATIPSGTGVIVPGTVLGRVTATGSFVPSPHAVAEGQEGAEVAVAIALNGCDATTAAQDIAIIRRDAEWNGHTLTFDSTVNDASKRATKVAQLATQGIIVRY
jgi:hypothetical protein